MCGAAWPTWLQCFGSPEQEPKLQQVTGQQSREARLQVTAGTRQLGEDSMHSSPQLLGTLKYHGAAVPTDGAAPDF